MKWHSRGLITQKELFNLVCCFDGDRSGEQVLARTDIACEYRLIELPQRKPRVIATELSKKGRLAINKIHFESEFIGKESA